MAVERWNAVNIPFPGTCCTVAVPTCSRAGGCIQDLVRACENVLKALRNKLFTVELNVLHSLLYVFHNRLRQHKPYLALKQIEQCVKRLHNMQLEGSIQDLIKLCPSMPKIQNTKIKHVPSQPVLEWMSLKVMGGSKLMLRLMDMCFKAFLLTTRYLRCEEFIVLNVVVAGLISRLWVLFRSIILSLDSLYDKLFLLLTEVTKIQHMTYLKEFHFPVSIRQWLGLSYSKVIQMKLPSLSSQMSGMPSGKTSLLDNLFLGPEPLLLEDEQYATSEGNKMSDIITPKTNQIPDIRFPVQDERFCEIETGIQLGFETKSLQAHSQNYSENIQKFVKEFNCRSSKKNKQPLPLLDEFVRRIGATQTFSVLCWELQTIFRWFRHSKLKYETCYLGNQFLRCHRLRMVEALGYSFPKKIYFIKLAICRYLTQRSRGKLHQDKMFKNCKSTVTRLQNCKMRQSKLYKVLPRGKKSSLKKKWTRIRLYAKKGSKRTLQTTPRFAFDTQAAIKRQCIPGNVPAEFVGNSGLYQNLENMTYPLGSLGGGSAVLPKVDDDIDDIFASIGV
ncbi:nucleolus and neural progenitor protein isoform X1 [Carcharodon carcharias]|uniref:nucleolus and neural progenitor protein isoform X1 n=2 Tax=Carcharodon carcharias TaxID=13397 RepID=UPI001B7F4440|nr:nucleolus and neural progenitor protein isoform X1 [Carcharodon carcharias]